MTAWLQLAHQEMGVEEVDGSNANPRIMEYFAAVSGSDWVKDDGTPWCGAFVAYIMATTGHKLAQEPLRARSWLAWGKPLDTPIPGCVVVLKRGSDPKSGHVGLYIQPGKDGTIYVLGGNQGNAVTIAKFRGSSVLGYRWPDEVKPEPPKPEGSRIEAEGQTVVKVGGTAAAGTAVNESVKAGWWDWVPSPGPLPDLSGWTGNASAIKGFAVFCMESWPWLVVAAGVYLVASGKAIKFFRREDAATGKTWGEV